jgi:hypothetical protein
MRGFTRSASLAFAAGAAGGLACSVALWAAGDLGATRALGVSLAPSLSAAWLYPRIVWGGLWGGLFLLPLAASGWVRRGLLLSLAPTLAQLLVVFPLRTRHGLFGLELGLLTPLVVAAANAVWGVTASGWLRSARG